MINETTKPKCKQCRATLQMTNGITIPKTKMAMYPIHEIKRLYYELAELKKIIGS